MSDDREAQRVTRRRQIAEQQATELEDRMSAHELDIARLDSIIEERRDDEWTTQRAAHEQAIADLRRAISATLDAAERDDSEALA